MLTNLLNVRRRIHRRQALSTVEIPYFPWWPKKSSGEIQEFHDRPPTTLNECHEQPTRTFFSLWNHRSRLSWIGHGSVMVRMRVGNGSDAGGSWVIFPWEITIKIPLPHARIASVTELLTVRACDHSIWMTASCNYVWYIGPRREGLIRKKYLLNMIRWAVSMVNWTLRISFYTHINRQAGRYSWSRKLFSSFYYRVVTSDILLFIIIIRHCLLVYGGTYGTCTFISISVCHLDTVCALIVSIYFDEETVTTTLSLYMYILQNTIQSIWIGRNDI